MFIWIAVHSTKHYPKAFTTETALNEFLVKYPNEYFAYCVEANELTNSNINRLHNSIGR